MKKILSLTLSIILIISLLVGCAAQDRAPMAPGDYNNSFDSIQGSASINKGEYGDIEYAPEEDAPELGVDPEQQDTTNTDMYLETQKLIYRCYIEMETLKFEETMATIKSMIRQYEGFIESDSMSDNSWNWYYEDYKKHNGTLSEKLVIRIPTDNYETFVNALNGSGKIMSSSEYVDNITKSYNDTTTTIAMYEKEEKMLLEMMDKCVTIQEMLNVESRLAEVQRKLAIYKSNLSDMDMDIAFSTITLQVNEVMEYTREEVEEITFIERVIEAIKDSCDSFLDVLSDLTITIIYLAPYIAIGVVVFIIIRFSIKKKRAKKTDSKTKTVESAQDLGQTQNKE